ncbi:hypothetical protein [Archangium sp.]|uniref:hypothetical protein n=1 Tax=Archangium sp. TaxID=1872627 RepID=UPI002D75627E|nr:hypothetical protein [Archangium sp.]HYO58237.1 hypothetical protein [Archangium sp.]
MNNRSRFVPPLAAALLLGAALALYFLWPESDAGPSDREMPSTTVSPASAPASPAAARAPQPEPVKSEPVKSEPHAVAAEGPRATEVPIGPGDVVPEPEVANPPPQQNDPIEPEKPQTAEWKHGKLVRITELLGRDVERLEQEREAAEASGNKEEAKRLEVQLARHRARLDKLHEQKAALAGQASQEKAE